MTKLSETFACASNGFLDPEGPEEVVFYGQEDIPDLIASERNQNVAGADHGV